MNENVSSKNSRKAEQFDFLAVHIPVHKEVIRSLQGEVDADCRHEEHRVCNVVKAHHLFEDVKLAVKWQFFVAAVSNDVYKLAKGWIEEDLKLSFDFCLIDRNAV